MVRISWDAPGERYYEAGVDRGVLYIADNPGIPWSGLTSVKQSPSGGDAQPYYIDGQKYLNLSSNEEYEATIEAVSSPIEFAVCDGLSSIQMGFYASNQPRQPFGFTYRTKVGNDVDAIDHGYKIHVVYNALAGAADRDYGTMDNSTDPLVLSWSVTTVPTAVAGIKPTAHYIIDSRYADPTVLATLEDELYGADGIAPSLPTAQEIADMFS